MKSKPENLPVVLITGALVGIPHRLARSSPPFRIVDVFVATPRVWRNARQLCVEDHLRELLEQAVEVAVPRPKTIS